MKYKKEKKELTTKLDLGNKDEIEIIKFDGTVYICAIELEEVTMRRTNGSNTVTVGTGLNTLGGVLTVTGITKQHTTAV